MSVKPVKFLIATLLITSTIGFAAAAPATDPAVTLPTDSTTATSPAAPSPEPTPEPAPPLQPQEPEKVLPPRLDLKKSTIILKGPGFTGEQFTFSVPNAYCFFRQVNHSANTGSYMTAYDIPGTKGTLRVYKDKNTPLDTPLKAGPLPKGSHLFITTDQYTLLVGPSHTYKNLDTPKEMVVSLAENTAFLSKTPTGWRVSYKIPQKANTFSTIWAAGSKDDLFNLGHGQNSQIWGNHDFVKRARLLLGGYYYKTPSTYEPYTEDSFWHIVSNYVANSLIQTGGNNLSTLLGNAQVQLMLPRITAAGYIPTLPQSAILNPSYGIKDGFFDTRFNGDTLKTLLIAYQKYQLPEYRQAYLTLAEYYMRHGRTHHFKVEATTDTYTMKITPQEIAATQATNVTLDEVTTGNFTGWLVYDYSQNPQTYGTTNPNHCSLNHQLAAITTFYLLYEQEEDPRYLAFADTMLRGITQTTSKWIMPNQNLEYAYMPDGSMGLIDYPYLTYNDLYELKHVLAKQFGVENSTIEALMAAKRTWMEANKITGYRGYQPK